jgi:coenzyme A diphosphatase NUDT7
VISVVFLVTDNTLNPILNPSEVSHLFSMPLIAFLHTNPTKIPGWNYGISTRIKPLPPDQLPPTPTVTYAEDDTHTKQRRTKDREVVREGGSGSGKNGYYGFKDIKWGEGVVRMHRFLTGREAGGVKPVFGLTAFVESLRIEDHRAYDVLRSQGYSDSSGKDRIQY